MDQIMYITQFAVCLAYFTICVRLLRLSQRSGETPERLLGVAFLVWGFSYLFYYPAYYGLEEGSLQSAFFFASGFADDLGTLALALVTRCVFRNRERWATWLVWSIGLCLAAGVGGSIWIGDWEGVSPLSNPWFWFEISGDVAAMSWIATEGFCEYRKARQRRRLDLCDPIVCNRYLLWGLSGVIWILYDGAIIWQYSDYELTQYWSPALDSLVSALGTAAVAVIWFVFFPPAFYRRWIQLADPAATAAEG
jgi:hypothetical protein